MNLKFALSHALGLVAGFAIPGMSLHTTNLTSSVQQHLADTYGELAKAYAAKLGADATMSGEQKLFAVANALVATAKRDGFKGVESQLFHAAIAVADAAYRASLPTIEADTIALATSLTSNPLVKQAEELVIPMALKAAESVVEKALPAPEQAATAAPAGAMLANAA